VIRGDVVDVTPNSNKSHDFSEGWKNRLNSPRSFGYVVFFLLEVGKSVFLSPYQHSYLSIPQNQDLLEMTSEVRKKHV